MDGGHHFAERRAIPVGLRGTAVGGATADRERACVIARLPGSPTGPAEDLSRMGGGGGARGGRTDQQHAIEGAGGSDRREEGRDRGKRNACFSFRLQTSPFGADTAGDAAAVRPRPLQSRPPTECHPPLPPPRPSLSPLGRATRPSRYRPPPRPPPAAISSAMTTLTPRSSVLAIARAVRNATDAAGRAIWRGRVRGRAAPPAPSARRRATMTALAPIPCVSGAGGAGTSSPTARRHGTRTTPRRRLRRRALGAATTRAAPWATGTPGDPSGLVPRACPGTTLRASSASLAGTEGTSAACPGGTTRTRLLIRTIRATTTRPMTMRARTRTEDASRSHASTVDRTTTRAHRATHHGRGARISFSRGRDRHGGTGPPIGPRWRLRRAHSLVLSVSVSLSNPMSPSASLSLSISLSLSVSISPSVSLYHSRTLSMDVSVSRRSALTDRH